MRNLPLISFGKLVSKFSKTLNRGNGSTWPGHIALKVNPYFVRNILKNSSIKTIIVAGTNGKTTTSSLIATSLLKNGKSVLQNDSGANLLNGVASTLLLNANASGKITQDYAIFEVDENALPLVLQQVEPDYLVLLNLFRDQLDRYGEINSITKKWKTALTNLSTKTKLILNGDDPQIAYLGFKKEPEDAQHEALYFGLDKTTKQQSRYAADSISCPRCGAALVFEHTTFSHLGNWSCSICGLKRPSIDQDTFPSYPLNGTYNQYNTHAAALVLHQIGFTTKQIEESFKNFTPAFGRQEIISFQGKNVQLFLSKNPTSFNQSFATIKELKASTLLLVLNDRIPDGRDVSWIWDTDLRGIEKFKQILIAGDRVYDMALRMKYELGIKNYGEKVTPYKYLPEAINAGIEKTKPNETFFILPTYSAMLEVRKILTGKKIL